MFVSAYPDIETVYFLQGYEDQIVVLTDARDAVVESLKTQSAAATEGQHLSSELNVSLTLHDHDDVRCYSVSSPV